MRYLALACDYDGTLARDGRVDDATLAALRKLSASGRKLILVTGRELPDLQSVFPYLDLFAWVVAENGALLYQPATREQKPLGNRPSEKFLQVLRQRGVRPVSAGRVIVATWRPHETKVLQVIRELGLEAQVIFNKDAVMVLPSGLNKATGLAAALKELRLSPYNIVGIGDAENDHSFLSLCACAVAVANALPAVKDKADVVTRGDHGRGVAELIDEIVRDDLRQRADRLTRHAIFLGTRDDGQEVRICPFGCTLLIAGPSGSGKSTAATSLLEGLLAKQYQVCIIDPEGDYQGFEGVVTLGNREQAPRLEEILQLLENPAENVVANLVGLPLMERPAFFLRLLPRIQEMRSRLGRPHWLLVDEAHHLMPTAWQPAPAALPQELDRMALITVHADQVMPAVLAHVDTVLAVGQSPETTLRQFAQAVGAGPPRMPSHDLQAGDVVCWVRSSASPPFRMHVVPNRSERRRHSRKYTEGELPPERSFYFRGPEGKLNLRAQNLLFFVQLAHGVDAATWNYHLHRGDFSRWFRVMIKDEALAAETQRIENLANLSADESRRLIRQALEKRYTMPAAAPFPVPGTDVAAVQ